MCCVFYLYVVLPRPRRVCVRLGCNVDAFCTIIIIVECFYCDLCWPYCYKRVPIYLFECIYILHNNWKKVWTKSALIYFWLAENNTDKFNTLPCEYCGNSPRSQTYHQRSCFCAHIASFQRFTNCIITFKRDGQYGEYTCMRHRQFNEWHRFACVWGKKKRRKTKGKWEKTNEIEQKRESSEVWKSIEYKIEWHWVARWMPETDRNRKEERRTNCQWHSSGQLSVLLQYSVRLRLWRAIYAAVSDEVVELCESSLVANAFDFVAAMAITLKWNRLESHFFLFLSLSLSSSQCQRNCIIVISGCYSIHRLFYAWTEFFENGFRMRICCLACARITRNVFFHANPVSFD